MKLKYSFVINEVAGQHVAVPAGGAVGDFNGMIKLNETGAFIFGLLKEDITLEDLTARVAAEYGVSEAEAAESVNSIIEKCHAAELLIG